MKNAIQLVGLVVLFAAGLFSCVMPGDIEELRLNLDDYQRGSITKEVFDERNAEIQADMDARNEALQDQGIPTDPMSIVAYLGGAAATIFSTNKIRDKRRRDRGERVTTETTNPTA